MNKIHAQIAEIFSSEVSTHCNGTVSTVVARADEGGGVMWATWVARAAKRVKKLLYKPGGHSLHILSIASYSNIEVLLLTAATAHSDNSLPYHML